MFSSNLDHTFKQDSARILPLVQVVLNKSPPPTYSSPSRAPSCACLPFLIKCHLKFISTHAGPQQKQFWDFTLFYGPLPMKAKGPFPNLWRFKCSFDTTILPLVFVPVLLKTIFRTDFQSARQGFVKDIALLQSVYTEKLFGQGWWHTLAGASTLSDD